MSKLSPPSKPKDPAQFYLFGFKSKFRDPLPPQVKVCRKSEMDQVLRIATSRCVFITRDRDSTLALLKSVLIHAVRDGKSQLLTIKPPPAESVPSLLGVFSRVIGVGESSQWLPVEELMKVLTGSDSANRFIGGAADFESESVALVRGNRQTLVLPFSAFEPSGDGTKPDFRELGFTDYGHTIILGNYEASADAVLYENDGEYRRKLEKERLQNDKSFGASLRRLRLQRKLTQHDFAPLAKKTIARIERNEVGKPHLKTLAILARKLSVSPDQIESY